jgi:flagellar motor component MotA
MSWLQAVGPTLLVLVGGIVTWFIKSSIEELRAAEKSLQEERRKVYMEILDPYIRLFADLKREGTTRPQSEALKRITSYEYRKTSFELNLFGSDEVVRAFNALMQHTYETQKAGKGEPKKLMLLWGAFLLELRKSLGNKMTSLDELDMLRGWITDIESS